MVSTFDHAQNTELGDDPEFQTIDPIAGTPSNGLLNGIQDSTPAASASEQQSQQPSLGEVIGGALALIVAAWLAGELLGEIFGSGADLTPVEQQILASQ